MTATTDSGGTPPGADLATVRADRSARFAEIRAERDQVISYLRDDPDEAAYLDEALARVRDVAVVLGSPRGGTSVFKQVLGAAPGALTLPGEHRLFFTLLGLNHPDHGQMDEGVGAGPLAVDHREFLLRNLLFECRGTEIADPTRPEWERYAWDWALRLRLQWPDAIEDDLERLVALVRDAVIGERTGPEPAFDVLKALIAYGLPVDPYRYDLPESQVRSYFPDLPLPVGPPGRTIVEISPYLALRPQRRPRLDQDRTVLLLKASSDAYRVPLIHELFTGWTVRELHLTRNPMAAVNGLIDGWEHRSFWQHDLSVHAAAGGARPSWNFDLCADWAELSHGDLPTLAARQWSDPHRRILRDARNPTRLRFEDFQAGGTTRRELMDRAAVAAGLRFDNAARAAVDRPRPVNSTAIPTLGRWYRDRPELCDLLSLPEVAEVSQLLGYDVLDWPRWP